MNQDSIEEWIQRVTVASQPFVQQNGPHGWLLKQSIFTHFQRLATLSAMPWFQALRGPVLDVGAGTGALSLDLAWRMGSEGRVTAVDRDAQALDIARGLAARTGVEIATADGDATALPAGDATQNLTIARFLFQHLSDPARALAEMRRTTQPGGRIVIIDVDDDTLLCEPASPLQITALRAAIRTLQAQRGGNRLIGRQLYRLMRDTGLVNIQVIVIPHVQLGVQNERNAAAEAYQLERLRREREALIGSGLMTAADFATALAETERGFARDRFEMEAEFIATGIVPAAH